MRDAPKDGELLPQGPVIISPDGLLPSLYREVIRRRPHDFKIGCLQDIRALFPADWHPFYAGFGNRASDEISYAAVGVPPGKIFTINPRGEVLCEASKLARSYTLAGINELVDEIFPALRDGPRPAEGAAGSAGPLGEREEFNDRAFWGSTALWAGLVDAEDLDAAPAGAASAARQPASEAKRVAMH